LLRATAVVMHSVDVQHAGVTHPAGIVQEAIRIRADASEAYDQCWCLVDVGDHASLARACSFGAESGINVAVSNPCFEIWLLWHHQDYRAPTSATELRRLLRALGHRDKRIPQNFPFEAHDNARKRSNEAGPRLTENTVGPNPSSAFGLVLDELQR
jgi:RloB-like protein